MKNFIQLLIFGLVTLCLVSCHKSDLSEDGIVIPDFSECECNLNYEPVCGVDSRNYLNPCYAACKNIEIVSETQCPNIAYNLFDTMTWPIVSVCIPVIMQDSPMEIKVLNDRTVLYKNPDGTFFRGSHNFCRCLPPYTKIAAINGEKNISDLCIGDLIWSFTFNGQKILSPIIAINKITVDKSHEVSKLILTDGRQLIVSPLHPDQFGCPIGEYLKGDILDGSAVLTNELIPYNLPYTYDILLDNETSTYLANGIILGSTLSPKTEMAVFQPN